ncbi:MAG: CooT family nickel-binding protein [Oscillospiraceae bacterium]|nr:CooT family nickel-binding protein [Oscillospiraceae bacterium]
MCLSTVYRNEQKKENLLCSDVTTIETDGRIVTLTDLFGRKMSVEGFVRRADLTGGTVVLEVKE